MYEQTVRLERMEHAVSLFGMFDANIKMIESEFGVSVTARGDGLKISGDEKDVLLAQKAISTLIMMLNKGEAHGVRPDMAVISPQGIVGVVVNTTKNFSTVMPVLHPSSSNSVKTKRDNLSGTLVWDGHSHRYATVNDIPTTHNLYKNDTIVTSGFANDFPEGVLVGYVSSLSTKPGSGFYNIKIRLATEFNNLDHVYIVNNHFKREQDSLMHKTEEEMAVAKLKTGND